ncbi:MAG: hypothetical protein WAT71_04360 [Ignavibacteria bacterium]
MKTLSEFTETSKSWESDLIVIEKMKVVVPLKLLLVCNSIASMLDGEEFSIVTNIKKKTSDTIILSEEYYIPKQKVTSGSIDYLPDEYSHSVVIHRHPNGLNTFSRTDHEFINQNFELSLLYTAEESFVNGLYNLKHEDAIIPIPVKAIIDSGIEDIDISNIEPVYKRTEDTQSTKLSSLYNDDYLYSYEDLFTEINEVLFRVEALEAELQDYKMASPVI